MSNFDWGKIDFGVGWEGEFPDIQSVLNAGLMHAGKFRDLTRADVAKRLTRVLGVEVSKHTINKWTRHDGNGHRFPYEYAAAFAKVTGDPRVLMWGAAQAGLMCLTPKLEKKFRIFELREQEEKIKTKRRMLEKELEE